MVRRTTIVALLVALSAPVLACWPEGRRAAEEHVLNRIGYGPDLWSLARIREPQGVLGYIEEQLYPHLLDDSELETELSARFPTLRMNYPELRFRYHVYGPPGVLQVRREMVSAKLLRAIRSKRQLEQVLVDFWFNHFNVDVRRGYARWETLPYERDAIRPHVLGRFEDMLRATAGHEAMLDYLDNSANFREGYVSASGRQRGINENYARELLELHTLGVEAPYTLTDIQHVARAFTGWSTLGILEMSMATPSGAVYRDEGHDKDAKSLLGELYISPGGGMDDGEAVIRYLARHPLTAERVARKLCVRFVSDAPPEALVTRVRDVYLSTDGDLRQVMREILTSPAFLKSHYRSKVKRPFAYVASLARAIGLQDEDQFLLYAPDELEKMGEPPYQAAPPTGYPEESGAWVAQGPFLERVNLAYRAAGGARGFARQPVFAGTSEELVDELVARLLPSGVGLATRTNAISIANSNTATTRVRETAAALLASPEFLSH